ncbi:hypothetical protein H7J88_09655 [Mycolicibacterium flavescens]|uniref:Uncharacterized protein n=2 Tax=Mycolicibacterium flavescens TaxID=1776 RepID=A0A1E3RRQ3_MYCFV|nr:hypothetical protein [Mycolicibacterium flavescens]ODQ92528.1 hypothetical protein BHQ18_02030 [Mycolicibacterium flavescens]
MSSKKSSDAIGGVIVFVVVVIALIPKEVWIFVGVVAGLGVVTAGIAWAIKTYDEHRAAAEAREIAEREAAAAAEKREREEQARREKQWRMRALGKKNAARVESALTAIEQVAASEAARAGWLGDVDFTADVVAITAGFEKAHALRKVIDQLSALDNPGADDKKILAEARATVDDLEKASVERVELIGKCAREARLIDESLRDERKAARTAEQRAELHAKLSAMLYGIEAAPDTKPQNSAADAVMARVQAYRDIKNQIQLTGSPGHERPDAVTSERLLALKAQVAPRTVRCFNCDYVQKVHATATVVSCVNCHVRMKLRART